MEFAAELPATRRRIPGTQGPPALEPFRRTAMMLRWFRKHGCAHCLTRDGEVPQDRIASKWLHGL
jgi:hypothetical protein